MTRKTFIVTGSASGLGRSIYEHMLGEESMNPIGIDIVDSHTTDVIMDVRKPEALLDLLTISLCGYQKKKEEGATEWKDGSVGWEKRIHGLINCAGVNYIDNMEAIPLSVWRTVMDTNATAIWAMTKELLPLLTASKGVILNIVSNASRVPMTHSIAYNASKGAAEIMTRQMARELTKGKGITVFGVNPNKLEGTKMSEYIEKTVLDLRGWTEKEAKQYQLNALLAGFETKVEWIAELIVWLLEKEHRHQYLTGCLLDLGA
jgi:NAD(P)-dependent dehydrogenase (short-subunit alcohol dehydrogenase family)